jgi:hypothetical protein
MTIVYYSTGHIYVTRFDPFTNHGLLMLAGFEKASVTVEWPFIG